MKEESLLLLSDLQKLINQVVLIDYTIIILVGESRPGFFGGLNHYDDKGHKRGHSNPGFLGGFNHYG